MQFGMPYGMIDSYGMSYGVWGILGLIFSILVTIGLVLLIKYLWETRGEISKEEFEEKKKIYNKKRSVLK